jgi:hypothetical protein
MSGIPRGKIKHLGVAGKGGTMCGVPGKSLVSGTNWTWKPELVTCKRCAKLYQERNNQGSKR